MQAKQNYNSNTSQSSISYNNKHPINIRKDKDNFEGSPNRYKPNINTNQNITSKKNFSPNLNLNNKNNYTSTGGSSNLNSQQQKYKTPPLIDKRMNSNYNTETVFDSSEGINNLQNNLNTDNFLTDNNAWRGEDVFTLNNLNNNTVEGYNLNLLLQNKQLELNNKDEIIEKLEISLEQTKTKLYEKRIDYEKLKLEFELANKKNFEFERTKNQKSEETSQIIKTLNMKEEDLAQIDKLVSNAETKFKLLEDKNAALQNQNDELAQLLINHKDHIISLQIKIENMDNQEKQLKSIINNLHMDMTIINKSTQEKLLNEAKNMNKTIKEREDDLKASFSKEQSRLNSVIEELKAENDKLKYSLQEKDLLVMTSEDKKSFVEIEIKQLSEKLQKEKDKNRKLAEEYNAMVKDVEEQLQDKDKVINFNIETFEKEEKKLNDRISELERQILSVNEEIVKHSRNSVVLSDKHKDGVSMIADREARIKGLKDQVDKLSQEINEKKTEIKENKDHYSSELKHKEEIIARIESERDEYMRLNLEMKQNLENADEEIRQISEALMAYENQINQEFQSKNNLSIDSQNMRKRIIQLESLVKNLNSELLIQKNNMNKLKAKYNSKIEKVR